MGLKEILDIIRHLDVNGVDSLILVLCRIMFSDDIKIVKTKINSHTHSNFQSKLAYSNSVRIY